MARYPYREIIEMRSTGIAAANVSYMCGVGLGKVGDITRAAKQLGIAWPVPPELGDDELEQLVDPIEHFRKHQPDFPAIAKAIGEKRLKTKHAPRAYEAYLEEARAAGGDPYTYSTFKVHFGKWIASAHPKLQMRVNWHMGEEIQLDWAGRKLELVSSDNVKAPAYLFVATLPFSDYTFVRASLDMGMQSWLEHHVRMFDYYGGVPLFMAIDNLATGITFHEDGSRTINQRYQDLADHYGTIIVPARVETPTDKAAVEGHVKIMANAIVGILEGMRFTSINQLNDTIAKLLEVFNGKPSPSLRGLSRREAYDAWERGAMQPLPDEPFQPVTWRKYLITDSATVLVRGNRYSAPEQFAGKRVFARISSQRVDLYDLRKSQCLASHPRSEDGSETFEGLPGTCPDRFRPLDDWARANGREQLLEQWDAEGNVGCAPSKIVCRSKKVVRWRCPRCGYAWQEAVVRRTKRSFDDCPACAGIALIEGVNDLATTHPEIAVEWNEELNPIPASAVFADWHQQMWWKGKCGHVWCAPVSDRTESAVGALCPYCSGKRALPGFNDVATLAPGLAVQWHTTKNRNARPENTSVCAVHQVYLWNGALSRVWRETPRAWLKRHDMEEVLEPFDRLVNMARAYDEAHPPAPSHSQVLGKGKATLKWKLFNSQASLKMSLREWCERFGHMELVEQWDGQRNAGLTPDDVSRCHRGRVWWTDPSCGHSWLETVRNRTFDDNGCIYCTRRKVLAGYSSLERLSAELLKLWHPTLNLPLTPQDVSDRSRIDIWWQCPVCGYEWQEQLRKTNATSRTCPACEKRTGYLYPGKNDLAGVNPRIAAMLDPQLNGEITSEEVYAQSKKRFWWRGRCGHVWLARVDNMASLKEKDACPYCSGRKLLRGLNDIASVSPEAAALWHPGLNGPVKPDAVRAKSSKQYWWRGECGHEWLMEANRMVAGAGCPYCHGKGVLSGFNDLASRFPEIAAQWHPVLNGSLAPKAVRCHSNRNVWWVCPEGHEWQARINNRVRQGSGCPVCSKRKVLVGVNDLRTTHGKLARQWHPTLNGNLRARDVTSTSTKKVWWRCKHGHEWQASVSRRAKGFGDCPYCAGRKAWPGFNDLATARPDLAAEWHPHSNKGLRPADVTIGYSKKVWWRAGCGHVFELSVSARAKAKKPSCPYCSGRKKPERPMR